MTRNEIKKKLCGICGEKEKITLTKNVGSDIWENGEQQQHLQRCVVCGASRLVCETLLFETGETKVFYGEWDNIVRYSF